MGRYAVWIYEQVAPYEDTLDRTRIQYSLVPSRLRHGPTLLRLYRNGTRVAGHMAPGTRQLVLDNFRPSDATSNERYEVYVMPPRFLGYPEELPDAEAMPAILLQIMDARSGSGAVEADQEFSWTDVEESESESEAEVPTGSNKAEEGMELDEEDGKPLNRELYPDDVVKEIQFCVDLLHQAHDKTIKDRETGVAADHADLHEGYARIHNASPEGPWKNILLGIEPWARTSRPGLTDRMGTEEMPMLIEHAEALGDFIAVIIRLLLEVPPMWWNYQMIDEALSWEVFSSGAFWTKQVRLAVEWATHAGHEAVKERGHNLVYLVHNNYGKSKDERRLVVTHIHVRVPQGFAYSIQYALQRISRADTPASVTTTPCSERRVPWTIAEVAQTQRKTGEDQGEKDGTVYSCRVDKVFAGVRAISDVPLLAVVLHCSVW